MGPTWIPHGTHMGFANGIGMGLIWVFDIGPIWVTYQIHIMGPMPIPFAKPMRNVKQRLVACNIITQKVRFL